MQLHVQRLFAPERAVVIKRGDPLGDGDKIRRALRGYPFDEVSDRRFIRAVVPRGKWRLCPRGDAHYQERQQREYDSTSWHGWPHKNQERAIRSEMKSRAAVK